MDEDIKQPVSTPEGTEEKTDSGVEKPEVPVTNGPGEPKPEELQPTE